MEPSEEVKKLAFEKVAQIKIYTLYQIAEVINLASKRGSFEGKELSLVGSLFDTIMVGVNKAFELSKEDLAKVSTQPKLETVKEDEEEFTPIVQSETTK